MLQKRIRVLISILFIGFGILGCELGPITTATTESSSGMTTATRYSILHQTPVRGDVKDIEIVDVEGNPNGFMYSVDEIRYEAVTNQVTIRFTLQEPIDLDAVYKVSLFLKQGSGSSSVELFVPNASPTQEIVFRLFSSSNWYVIKVEKANRHPITKELVIKESYRRIELRLVSFEQVHRIDDVDISLVKYELGGNVFTSALEGHTFQEVNVTFKDHNRAVSQLRIAFLEKRTGLLCAETIVQVSSSRDISGIVTISNIRVDGLIPGMTYIVVAYASGNNGLRLYQDTEIVKTEYSTLQYGAISKAQSLAMHAYITHEGIKSDSFPVHVRLHYDETTLHPKTDQPFSFVLRLKDKAKNVLWEQTLENETDIDVMIPNKLLTIDALLVIEDVGGTYWLASTSVPFYNPKCTGKLRTIESTRYFSLFCSEGDATFTGGTIEIYSGDTLITTIPFDMKMSKETVTLTLPAFESENIRAIVVVRLTYTAFNGHYEGILETTIQ